MEKDEESQLLQAKFRSQVNLCSFHTLSLLNLSSCLEASNSLISLSNTFYVNSVQSAEATEELRPKVWLAHPSFL